MAAQGQMWNQSTPAPPAYTFSALWRRYPYDPAKEAAQKAEEGVALNKSLKVWDLMAYGIGSTVGAGIFVVTGVVAQGTAGPAIIVSFLLAAFASLMSAFCYAEFAARIPVSGSAYTFSYATVGEFIGWVIGWNLTLEYAVSASAVARGWSGYVVSFFSTFKVTVPNYLAAYEVADDFFSLSVLSVLIIVAMTGVMLIGAKESSTMNLIITILNMTIIVFVIITGAFYIDTSNWSDFFPFGIKGAISGAGTVFFSFIGFDSVTTLSGEVANPSRDLPVGIVATLGVATVLYVAVSLIVTGMVNYSVLDKTAPLSQSFETHGLHWAAGIIAAGSVTTLTSTTYGSLMGQPRIFYQMACDGLLPPFFKTLNKKQVPVYGTLITGCAASIIAFFFDIVRLTEMISIGTLMAFTIVCCSIMVLRYQSPEEPAKVPFLVTLFVFDSLLFASSYRFDFQYWALGVCAVPVVATFAYICTLRAVNVPTTFRCPLMPLVPCIGVLVNVYLIVTLSIDSIYRVIVWTVIGLIIYFGYGIRHSVLRFQLAQEQQQPSYAKAINDSDPLVI
eukprot:TRINITY_DN4644_c0_g1_i1.p1 TRINITY_DN4644_c0_g1~~TRINITY_DN4644_c0_g1_i1.p1  ORF type:complete len:560 (+),score=79.80 TRINITY_DN4644_c0_g1_i1:2026-3705(+)